MRDELSAKKIKISIIEDSEIHAEWLQTEIADDDELEVVRIDRFGRSGIESVRACKPDLVLLDFQLEDMTGLEALKWLKAHDENVRVFIVTAHSEASIIDRIVNDKNVDAIAIKGSRYLEENLLNAIKDVASGGVYLDPSLLRNLRELQHASGLTDLTKREFEVFIQANSGKTDIKIAEDLCVEVAYIKNLKSKISKKIKHVDLNNLLLKLIENSHPRD